MARSVRRSAYLSSLTHEERAQHLVRVSGYVGIWGEACQRQAQRVLNTGILDMQPECWTFAAAMGGLLRCVGLARDLGLSLEPCLAAFEEAAPDARGVRDVLEHLEDYELGLGKRPSVQGRLEFLYMRGANGSGFLQLQGLNLTLHLPATQDALARLVQETLDAIDLEISGYANGEGGPDLERS